jgi:tetratricopeptide (TPR) repeat protein
MVRGRDAYGRSVVAQDLAYLLTVYGGREFHRWYEEARRRTIGEEDTRSRASLLRTLGYFVYYQGRFAEAVRLMREARPIAIESGDRYAEADTLLIEAMGTGAISSPEEAVPIADEAIALGREVGSKRIRALGGLVRARASLRSGEPLKASRQLVTVRKLLEVVPTRPDLIEVTLMEASLHLDRGSWPAAIAVGEALGEAAARIGWRMWEPHGPLIVGRAHLGAGRPTAASEALATAATLARRCDAVGLLALARALRTEAMLLDGHVEPGIAVDEDDPVIAAVVSGSDGLRWARMDRWESAADAFADAAERWGRIGLTVWLARALAFRAEALRRAGDTRAATASLRRAEEVLAALRTPVRERTKLLTRVTLAG